MREPMRSLPITVLAAALLAASPAVAQSEQPEGEKPSNEGIAPPEAPSRTPLQSSPTSAGPAEPTRYLVQIAGDKGATVTVGDESCIVPCRLTFAPGRNDVQVSGASSFRRQVELPAADTILMVECLRPIPAALGAVGLGVGTSLAVLGTYLTYVNINGNPCNGISTNCSEWDVLGKTLVTVGGVWIAASGLVVAAVLGGVGLGRMGKDRLDFGAPERSAREKQPSLRLAGLAAAPVRGGALLGATFVF
jgi:hypothetical protein